MIDKARALAKEFADLHKQMQDPKVLSDPKKIATIGKRISDLEPLIKLIDEYEKCEKAIATVDEVSDDAELKILAEEEAQIARERIKELEEEMKVHLIPKDPDDGKNVILEVRAGTGGEEAALFAAELLRMYLRFTEEQGWKIQILSKADADSGGLKEVICEIQGDGAYGKLKFESGVHRVQRVPVTESKGRLHTSAATVAILPEAEEVDVKINPEDVRVDVFRSSGPGGQSVNTTDSAVRITHEPTGITVSCQDEKSQHKNKARAMSILRSRLYAAEQERLSKERGDMRLGQIGSGDRSEKIRTYNYPQDRVTDHRIGQNFSNLPGILEGNLGGIIEALKEKEQEEKMAEAS
ncbi:MAG: peptide chain release factor 1 [Candidatus Peribacteraceae bacterium]|jgi:peptide chain release factor 1|nr:peptide chain release factor 1 [Candidatus Peribacteraceae bacterium]MDP7454337.1 peptide chain release factor 1 [Candidatus Peribacteraceae bacterium]MDP7645735.1 peptide chain release factor 1 [Candidatus Peribacteraceae bacterium]|tara:strand:- start:680 stop:1738 length:1059 start_codon:yes stop_codon:yes gene_type:complete